MKIFGLNFNRKESKALSTVSARGDGWFRVLESFTGAWQKNIVVDQDTVLSYSTVYACVSLIAADIGKLRVKLDELLPSGVWREIAGNNSAFLPVLRKPNRYQTRVKFWEHWITSKLIFGNTYALKQRDQRGVVQALYILDPTKVTPLVSDDGAVFYQLSTDNMAGGLLKTLDGQLIVPARDLIHDRMVTLFHPLVGVSPIFACGLASMQGVNIQTHSAVFFKNAGRPSGILTAPGAIKDETAQRLKAHWETEYAGENSGKTAVLGDGLTYQAMSVNAVDSQLIEQLKWTAETVCSCFHVPPYMVGVGVMPAYNNIEALNQQYYSQCLQSLIESAELCLDEGLELPANRGTEFDLKALLRMDTAARFKTHSDAIAGGWLTPNEARIEEDLEPVDGGETPYMQQQNWPLKQLAERPTPSSMPAPPGGGGDAVPPDGAGSDPLALPPPDAGAAAQAAMEVQAQVLVETFLKGLQESQAHA